MGFVAGINHSPLRAVLGIAGPAPSGSFFLGVHLDILDKVQPVRNSGILHHPDVLRAHVYADAGALADRPFHLLG